MGESRFTVARDNRLLLDAEERVKALHDFIEQRVGKLVDGARLTAREVPAIMAAIEAEAKKFHPLALRRVDILPSPGRPHARACAVEIVYSAICEMATRATADGTLTPCEDTRILKSMVIELDRRRCLFTLRDSGYMLTAHTLERLLDRAQYDGKTPLSRFFGDAIFPVMGLGLLFYFALLRMVDEGHKAIPPTFAAPWYDGLVVGTLGEDAEPDDIAGVRVTFAKGRRRGEELERRGVDNFSLLLRTYIARDMMRPDQEWVLDALRGFVERHKAALIDARLIKADSSEINGWALLAGADPRACAAAEDDYHAILTDPRYAKALQHDQ
jgi:hypothetical protein